MQTRRELVPGTAGAALASKLRRARGRLMDAQGRGGPDCDPSVEIRLVRRRGDTSGVPSRAPELCGYIDAAVG